MTREFKKSVSENRKIAGQMRWLWFLVVISVGACACVGDGLTEVRRVECERLGRALAVADEQFQAPVPVQIRHS